MTRGLTVAAQRITTQHSPRIFFSTGLPPLALEKCLQSGENHASPTGRPAATARGSASQTSWQRCRVAGWFALCMATALASWLMAMSIGRPIARSMPSDAPPPPAKLSTTISSGRSIAHPNSP